MVHHPSSFLRLECSECLPVELVAIILELHLCGLQAVTNAKGDMRPGREGVRVIISDGHQRELDAVIIL